MNGTPPASAQTPSSRSDDSSGATDFLHVQDPFLLLSSLAKALAHKIRTPLAVISNELSYLVSQGHECTRALQRSKDINEILKLATSLSGVTERSEASPIVALLLPHFPSIAYDVALRSEQRWVDPMHFSAFMKLLTRLVSDLRGSDEEPAAALLESDRSGRLSLTVRCKLAERTSVAGEFPSLTALFSHALHLDLIEPPLIDAAACRLRIILKATLQEGTFTVRCGPIGAQDAMNPSNPAVLGAKL